MSEIKPCPFCGGEPYIHEPDFPGDRFQIGCENHGENEGVWMEGETLEEAIAAWNQRPTPEPTESALPDPDPELMGKLAHGLLSTVSEPTESGVIDWELVEALREIFPMHERYHGPLSQVIPECSHSSCQEVWQMLRDRASPPPQSQDRERRAMDRLRRMAVGDTMNVLRTSEKEWHISFLVEGGKRFVFDVADPADALADDELNEALEALAKDAILSTEDDPSPLQGEGT